MTWLDGFQRVTYAHTPGLPSWPIRGIVFHTTEGSTFEGADSVYRRTNAAPHFTVDPWRELRVQHIDTSMGAYALRNLPGGVETNTTGVVQVEVVGYTAEGVAVSHGRPQFGISKLSEWNYRWLGEMVLRPILDAHPTIPRSIYAGDRMNHAEWMAWPGGICAHAHVPENDHWDGSTLDFEQMLGYASPLTPQGDLDMNVQQLAAALGGSVVKALDGSEVVFFSITNSGGQTRNVDFRTLAEDILVNAEVGRAHSVADFQNGDGGGAAEYVGEITLRPR